MTRQLWLILDAHASQPGDYRAVLKVTSPQTAFEVPLTATIYPVEMPANPAYNAQSWGYFTWPAAQGFEQQAADEQQRCYENSHVLHHFYVPWPKVNEASGKLLRPIEIDTRRLDEMLALRPYVKQWLFWPGFEFGYTHLNYYHATDMPQVGTAEHESLFKQWVKLIRDHMQAKGFYTRRWAFYWTDEPRDEQFLKYVVPASNWAKQGRREPGRAVASSLPELPRATDQALRTNPYRHARRADENPTRNPAGAHRAVRESGNVVGAAGS